MDFSRETFERLALFVDLLLKWRKAISLVSEKTVCEVWTRHIVDSAQVIPFIPSAASLVDVGTGAGFPGLVLSIIKKQSVHLVESDQKKCVFLQEAIRITGSSAILHSCPVESFKGHSFDVLVSRAFSSMEKFFYQTFLLKRANSQYIFFKGASFQKELDDVLKKWHFDYELYPSCTHPQGKLIVVSNLRRINGP